MTVAADPGHPRDRVKPRMRGVLHQWAAVVSVVLGVVLVSLSHTTTALVGTLVYTLAMLLLFGTSALYHRRTWSEHARTIMKRLDHSMIFVLIAGTYTPIALVVLTGTSRWVVLGIAWGGALLGVVMRMIWLRAPRFAIIPLYIGLGWVAVFVLPQLLHRGGVAALVLLLTGGLFYSVGAVFYASRRPDPWPRTFGYHEMFHAFTLAAALCHYLAIFVALNGVGAVA